MRLSAESTDVCFLHCSVATSSQCATRRHHSRSLSQEYIHRIAKDDTCHMSKRPGQRHEQAPERRVRRAVNAYEGVGVEGVAEEENCHWTNVCECEEVYADGKAKLV